MAIVLVDYHKGNIRSVERGLQAAGADVLVSDCPQDVRTADAVVLPGVGAFSDASATLEQLGLADALREVCAQGMPFLGICLGMHLMFREGAEHASPESPASGLGLLEGLVGRVPATSPEGQRFKVPHVGWNSVELVEELSPQAQALFEGIRPGEFFYFTHSFQAPQGLGTVARTCHACWFPSVVEVPGKPQFGVQFHPEKSSEAGARLLRNFVELATS